MSTPKLEPLVLTDEERGVLNGWSSRRRSRFLARRLEGLSDEPRPGRPRLITDDQVERVITKTLEETPGRDTHWSTRSMATQTGMSQSAVSRIWRAFGLKPHLVETWKLSTDPQFIEKVHGRRRLIHGAAGERAGVGGG